MLSLRSLDPAVDVAAIAVYHYNVKELLTIYITVFVGDDVRMPYLLKQSYLYQK